MVHGLIVLLLLGFVFPAQSELCSSKHIKEVHYEEIDHIKERPYWRELSSTELDYTARLLACHARVDSKKVKADRLEDFLFFDFFDDLPKRTVHGRIRYLYVAPLGYGYTLKKENGVWLAELIMKFHYPILNKKNSVDIHQGLARKLGIWESAEYCGKTIFTKNFDDWTKARHRHVERGRLVHKGRRYAACRLPRTLKFGGKTLLEHHMNHWREDIENSWSKPGFKLAVKIANLGEVSKRVLRRYRKRGLLWRLRFNLRPSSRNTYRSLLFKPFPHYLGTSARVMTHEAGHFLGFNDEYPEFPWTRKKPEMNCRGQGGRDFMMCTSYGEVQPFYTWTLTKRYVHGRLL